MSLIPDITLDTPAATIALPADLEWPNRVIGWAIGQDVQTSVTGALVVQEGVRQAGRPITLQSGNDGTDWWGIVDYDVAQALLAAANAGGPCTLTIPTIDGTEVHPVRWDASDPITARELIKMYPPGPKDWWAITLKFIVVE